MPASIFLTDSVESTQSLAIKLAKELVGGNVVLLWGGLAAGKTTFTQGLGRFFGISRMTSPTYVILNQYEVKNHPSIKTLYHFDLYRLENVDQLRSVNFDEVVTDKHGLVVLEWPERLEKFIPTKSININFKTLSGDHREITITK